MAYDPNYGNPNIAPEQESPAAMVAGFVSPIGYLQWKYTMSPNTWSPNRGIAVPFGGRNFKGGARIKVGGIQKNISRKKAIKLFKEGKIGKFAVAKAFVGGSWRTGSKTLRMEKVAIGRMKQMQNAIYNQLIDKRTLRPQTAYKLSKQLMGKFYTDALPNTRKYKGRYQITKLSKLSDTDKGILNTAMESVYGSAAKGKMRPLNTKLNMGALVGRARFIRSIATVGKIGSVVGAGMFLWELTQAIGEPVGRALMNDVNSGLTAWENRFTPEVGGRLSYDYLTRGAATERQRAIQKMDQSQINGRTYLGNESSYIHQ